MNDPTQPKRILLVDDSRDEREMYAEFLHYRGYSTVEADTASDAYRLAVELHPDVVVTSVRLRGQEDGLELTRRIKGDDQTRQLPVVVLSGFVMGSHTDAAAQAGCDLFVPKPCLPDALGSAIDGLLRRES
jgi:two-component system, cell cycle response regulator DivK